MAEQYKYTVCIHCMTYNHEKYLADALEGFVMQKTNFPFVAVVIDDFSTDGTADVLRQYEAKYPDIIKAVYLKENYYSQHKSKKPFLEPYDSQAKYIAICEGDDYWTDPYKLQKQVDFLEVHLDYSMCFHKVRIESYNYELDKGIYDHLEEREYTAREVYDKWTVPTCSVMYRANIHIPPSPRGFVYGDIYAFLNMLRQGRGYCLGFEGGVYRRLQTGVSSQNNGRMYVRLIHQYEQMFQLFPELQDITMRTIEIYRKELAATHVFNGSYKYRWQKMCEHPCLLYRPYALKTLFWHIMKLKKDIIIDI